MDAQHKPSTEFSIQSATDLKLSDNRISEVEKEKSVIQSHHATTKIPVLTEEIKQRYQFSQYLLDPNLHFLMVTRIMAFVFKFFNALLRCIRKKNTNQTSKTVNSIIVNHPPSIFPEELEAAEQYFYKKGSQEVIQYLPKKKYVKLATQSNDGLLMYTGRILPGNDVSIVGNFTDTMKDL